MGNADARARVRQTARTCHTTCHTLASLLVATPPRLPCLFTPPCSHTTHVRLLHAVGGGAAAGLGLLDQRARCQRVHRSAASLPSRPRRRRKALVLARGTRRCDVSLRCVPIPMHHMPCTCPCTRATPTLMHMRMGTGTPPCCACAQRRHVVCRTCACPGGCDVRADSR